jgi:hypothetical protein
VVIADAPRTKRVELWVANQRAGGQETESRISNLPSYDHRATTVLSFHVDSYIVDIDYYS